MRLSPDKLALTPEDRKAVARLYRFMVTAAVYQDTGRYDALRRIAYRKLTYPQRRHLCKRLGEFRDLLLTAGRDINVPAAEYHGNQSADYKAD
jgi:hypothetical protein